MAWPGSGRGTQSRAARSWSRRTRGHPLRTVNCGARTTNLQRAQARECTLIRARRKLGSANRERTAKCTRTESDGDVPYTIVSEVGAEQHQGREQQHQPPEWPPVRVQPPPCQLHRNNTRCCVTDAAPLNSTTLRPCAFPCFHGSAQCKWHTQTQCKWLRVFAPPSHCQRNCRARGVSSVSGTDATCTEPLALSRQQ